MSSKRRFCMSVTLLRVGWLEKWRKAFLGSKEAWHVVQTSARNSGYISRPCKSRKYDLVVACLRGAAAVGAGTGGGAGAGCASSVCTMGEFESVARRRVLDFFRLGTVSRWHRKNQEVLTWGDGRNPQSMGVSTMVCLCSACWYQQLYASHTWDVVSGYAWESSIHVPSFHGGKVHNVKLKLTLNAVIN